MLKKMGKQIIVIRGFMAVGKTTALYNLKSNKMLKDWLFVDFEAIRKMFNNNKETMIAYSESSFYAVLKELMKTGKNIITQETSKEFLLENIGAEIKKYGYEVKVIALMASKEITYQRAKKRREEKGIKPRSKKEVYNGHGERIKVLEKENIKINTNKLSPSEVTKEIIRVL